MKRTNIILLGDFSLNILPKAQDISSSIWKFRQLLNKFNLKNVINKATRITDTNTTLNDLAICSDFNIKTRDKILRRFDLTEIISKFKKRE